MKTRKLVVIVGWGLSFLAFSPAFAADKIIACPALSAAHYGKNVYYDSRSGKTWRLTWKQHQRPVWNNALIPKTMACGSRGPSSKYGARITYQCVHLQCESNAVIATLGEEQALKCFSAYVSTQNRFYCDDFSIT